MINGYKVHCEDEQLDWAIDYCISKESVLEQVKWLLNRGYKPPYKIVIQPAKFEGQRV